MTVQAQTNSLSRTACTPYPWQLSPIECQSHPLLRAADAYKTPPGPCFEGLLAGTKQAADHLKKTCSLCIIFKISASKAVCAKC